MWERETDEDYVTVITDKTIHAYTSKIAGIERVIYSCKSGIGGVERRCQLKYILPYRQWEWYKV